MGEYWFRSRGRSCRAGRDNWRSWCTRRVHQLVVYSHWFEVTPIKIGRNTCWGGMSGRSLRGAAPGRRTRPRPRAAPVALKGELFRSFSAGQKESQSYWLQGGDDARPEACFTPLMISFTHREGRNNLLLSPVYFRRLEFHLKHYKLNVFLSKGSSV